MILIPIRVKKHLVKKILRKNIPEKPTKNIPEEL